MMSNSETANAEREEWAAFDPQEFLRQGAAGVQLAQVFGRVFAQQHTAITDVE
jgi:hypothetical protein